MATSKDKPKPDDTAPEPVEQGWIGERAEDTTTGSKDA